jgi:hypothetical protein
LICVVSIEVDRTSVVRVFSTPDHAWIFAMNFSREAVFSVRTFSRRNLSAVI